MNLLAAFSEFKNGTRKSKMFKNEESDEKQKTSNEKNESNKDKAKKIKDSLKEKCEHCNGSGLLESTEDKNGKCLSCTQCLGRGYIKKRKKPNLKAKKKKRDDNLIGKKAKKRIIKMFLDDGLTEEEISDKINIEEYLVKQVITDMKNKLEQRLNKNN